MSVGFGINGFIGFGEETTFGTGVTITRWMEIVDESIQLKQAYIPKPSLRTVTQRNKVRGKKTVGGSFKVLASYEDVAFLLKHAMGSNVDSGAGPYVHTLALASVMTTGLTVVVNRDATNIGGSSCHRYVGCMIAKLTLSLKTEDFMMVEVELVGQDGSLVALASPTFRTFVGIDWQQVTVFTLAGNAVAAEDLELTIDNALQTDRYKLASRVVNGLNRSGPRIVGGKFSLEYSSLTEDTLWRNMSNAALAVTLVSGTSSMVITCPVTTLDGEEPTNKDAGVLKQTIAFTAFQNAAINDELAIVVTNDSATP